jgi:hypothetical protein
MSALIMAKSVAYRDRDELFGGASQESVPNFLYLLDTYMLYDVINGNILSQLTYDQKDELSVAYNAKIFGS